MFFELPIGRLVQIIRSVHKVQLVPLKEPRHFVVLVP